MKSILSIFLQQLLLLMFSFLLYVYPIQFLLYWTLNYTLPVIVTIGLSIIITSCLIIYFKTKNTHKSFKSLLEYGVGIGYLGCLSTTLILTINIIYSMPNNINSYALIFLTSLLTFYSKFKGCQLTIKSLQLKTTKLTKQTTFIFISDVHLGTQSAKDLDRIITKIKHVKPAFVCIGGDLIDSSAITIQDLKAFKQLSMPIYFVTGNHEYYLNHSKKLLNQLNECNIQWLRNTSTSIDDITLIGISDNQTLAQKCNKLSQFLPSKKYTIALVHKPSCYDKLAQKPNLMLSGHTHNGQIWPFNLIVKLQFPKIYGLYTNGDSCIYISSGAGAWGTKMRLGSSNEIVRVTISPQ